MSSRRRNIPPSHCGLSKHQRALVRNAALNIETNIKYLLLQYMTPEYSREFLYQMSTAVNFYSLSKLPMLQAIQYVQIADGFNDFLLDWSGCDDSIELLNEDFNFCLDTLRKMKDLYTGSDYPTLCSESPDSEPVSLDYLRELVEHVTLDDDQRYMIGVELQRLQEMRPNGDMLMNYHGV